MSTATPYDTERSKLLEPQSSRGTLTWEIARLYPEQCEWSEEEYINLDTNHLIEYVDGCLEFLPLPTMDHQLILLFLSDVFRAHILGRKLGRVLIAPYPIRLRKGKYREPDVVFLSKDRPFGDKSTEGADLVVEIVSPDRKSRKRDLAVKRNDYAAAAIPEYWIVDPEVQTVTVLVLDGEQYRTHGTFKPGETATSVLLDGFTVDVAACFAAADA